MSLVRLGVSLLLVAAGFAGLVSAETFRVASYNLNNYVLEAGGNRPQKSVASLAQVHRSILQLRPDVLAVQELGGAGALQHLQAELRRGGLDLAHSERVTGWDTNIQVAVLSRFPIVARRPHARENFLLDGRRFRVSRGFLEVDLAVTPRYEFTLLVAHLKSKRPIPETDEAEFRLEEARLLRSKIDARLKADPNANLVVLGDFNDTKDSRPIRLIRGRGRTVLIDTRPAEANGDTVLAEEPGHDPHNITWTYHYGVEDTYSRVDYILINRAMEKEWLPAQTFVLAAPNWGLASDHRPIVATFEAAD